MYSKRDLPADVQMSVFTAHGLVCIEEKGIEINEIVNNNKKEFVPLFHFRIKLHFISLKSFIVIERVNMLETQTPLTLSHPNLISRTASLVHCKAI